QSGTAWIDGTNASATLGAERGLDEEQQKTESNASGGVFNLCNTRVEVLIRSRRNRIQGKPGYRVAGLKRRCRRVPASPGVGSDLPISRNCSGSYGCRLRALFAALPVRGSSRSFLSMGVPRKVYGFFPADYVWAAWAAAGIVSVAIALYVCLAALLVRSDRN